ncbi:hypothetical protein ACLK11_04585 [Escherichia coli]
MSANPGLTAPFVCVCKKRVGKFLMASSIKRAICATLCNPPLRFRPAARAGSERKRRNLGLNKDDA